MSPNSSNSTNGFTSFVERKDFSVVNFRKQRIQCSLYTNKNIQCKDVVVVYLHGNAGTRLDGVPSVKYITQEVGIDLCSFDFSGCGKSDGEYVSLGLKEQDDLQAVLEKLINIFNYSKVILYGRSMGGVTSLLYCANRSFAKKYVISIIVDSPFCSLKKLATDIADEKVSFFGGFIAEMSFDYIRDIIKNMIQGHDIFSLEVDQQVSKSKQNALFCYSYEDRLIKHTHSEKLIENYGGKASSFVFSGDHNAFRDESYFTKIKKYIQNILTENKINIINNQKTPLNLNQSVNFLSKFSIQPKDSQNQYSSFTDRFLIYQQVQNNHLISKCEQNISNDRSPVSSNTDNQITHNISLFKQNSETDSLSHLTIFKQKSLPEQHTNSLTNNCNSTNQKLKKQQSYIQINMHQDIATKITLSGQNNNVVETQTLQNNHDYDYSYKNGVKQNDNYSYIDKQHNVTLINGLKKTPSQPLIFPQENTDNKKVPVIDQLLSQRQPKNDIFNRQSPNNVILEDSQQPPSQKIFIFPENDQNDDKRKSPLLRKIQSVSINKSAPKQQSQTSTIKPPNVSQFQENTMKTTNEQVRVSDIYYLNHHRSSISIPSSQQLSNASTIQTMNGSNNQDNSNQINNLNSLFVSPRIIQSYYQQSQSSINNSNQTPAELKQIDMNVPSYSQNCPIKQKQLQSILNPQNEKQIKNLIQPNLTSEFNENNKLINMGKSPQIYPQFINSSNEINHIKPAFYQTTFIPPYESLLYKDPANLIQNTNSINDNKFSVKTKRIM